MVHLPWLIRLWVLHCVSYGPFCLSVAQCAPDGSRCKWLSLACVAVLTIVPGFGLLGAAFWPVGSSCPCLVWSMGRVVAARVTIAILPLFGLLLASNLVPAIDMLAL